MRNINYEKKKDLFILRSVKIWSKEYLVMSEKYNNNNNFLYKWCGVANQKFSEKVRKHYII